MWRFDGVGLADPGSRAVSSAAWGSGREAWESFRSATFAKQGSAKAIPAMSKVRSKDGADTLIALRGLTSPPSLEHRGS